MFRYFAYGSVLSKRHVGEWAGEHGVDARLFARGAPADYPYGRWTPVDQDQTYPSAKLV